MDLSVRPALLALSCVFIAASCGERSDPTDPMDPVTIETGMDGERSVFPEGARLD